MQKKYQFRKNIISIWSKHKNHKNCREYKYFLVSFFQIHIFPFHMVYVSPSSVNPSVIIQNNTPMKPQEFPQLNPTGEFKLRASPSWSREIRNTLANSYWADHFFRKAFLPPDDSVQLLNLTNPPPPPTYILQHLA